MCITAPDAEMGKYIVNLIEIINKIDKYRLANGPSIVSHRKSRFVSAIVCHVSCIKNIGFSGSMAPT